MVKYYILSSLLLGWTLFLVPSAADDDSHEWGGNSWDDSHEDSGWASRRVHSWQPRQRSVHSSSWNRYDDSGESYERFGGNRWAAKPVRQNTWSSSSFGRPLQSRNVWQRNTWSPKRSNLNTRSWSSNNNNVWNRQNQRTTQKWNSNKWSTNSWNRNNQWNTGRRSFNSGKWNPQPSWNRRW